MTTSTLPHPRGASGGLTRMATIALVRRLETAANAHDVATLAACYAADATAVSPQFGELKGRRAIADAWAHLFAVLPDCSFQLGDVLVDGNRVAILGRVTATDSGGWFGLPSTGAPIRYHIKIVCTVENGAIVHDERIYDSASVIERLERRRLDRELRMAADVQRALVGRTTIAARFCEVATYSSPCRAIGGDFVEAFDLPSGDVGLLLGDVAGKGPAAALLAAMIQGMFAAAVGAGGGPAATLARVNQLMIARQIDARFATVVYGVLAPDGRLTYANAGHHPPAVVSRQGVRRLTVGGSVVGIFDHATFHEETVRLAHDDTVVIVSDGITEARNAAGEEFGDERLVATAGRYGDEPAGTMRCIVATVQQFCSGVEQADDITVAVARFISDSTHL